MVAGLGIAILALGGTVSSASSTQAKVVKVALIQDLTGGFSTISGPQPSQAFIRDLNSQGGLNGWRIVAKVYDGQSTTAGTLQAARRAAQDKPNAILMGAWNASSANAFLAKTGIPVVGFGALGGYGGYNNIFSDIGDAATHVSDVWLRVLALRGHKKVALLDTIYETKFHEIQKQLAPGLGLDVVFETATLTFPLDAPTALQLAQKVKASGATGVWVASGGEQIAAYLNQLNYKATVLEVSAFGPGVIQQLGDKIEGMVFGSAFASPYVKNNPNVTKYIRDMRRFGYSQYTYNNPYAIEHYGATKMLFDAMAKAGAPYSRKATVAQLNKLKRYTAGGLLAFVTFPQWHTISSDCAATATVTNGRWVADKNGLNPFICSKSGSVPLGG